MLSRPLLPLATLSLALVFAACDTEPDTSRVSEGPSPSCLEAEDHSDLAFIQAEIFTPSCANFTACHKSRDPINDPGGAPSARGLNLEDGQAQIELVNQPALILDDLGQPTMNLVTPGDPDNSYLVVIMEGTRQELLLQDQDGPVTMPFRAPLLCEQKIGAVRRWIDTL